MVNLDRDALICDLAETYHIFNYEAVPARMLARLSVGLREDSRIKKKALGVKVNPPLELIQVMTLDTLRLIYWALCGGNKNNRPTSLTDLMMGTTKDNQKDVRGFLTGAEFEKAREKIIKETK